MKIQSLQVPWYVRKHKILFVVLFLFYVYELERPWGELLRPTPLSPVFILLHPYHQEA